MKRSLIILITIAAILIGEGVLLMAAGHRGEQLNSLVRTQSPAAQVTPFQVATATGLPAIETSTTSSPANSAPTIRDIPASTPAFLLVGVPTTVTFTVPLTNANVISKSVNLLRIPGTGAQSTIIGQLHDDGENGDIAADDQIYSIRLQLTEASTGIIEFKVSAAFKGVLARSLSPVLNLHVYSAPPPLPPDPGAVGAATLLGIDSDQDGIRDDVERYIALNYPASARMRAGLTQLAVAELAMIEDADDPALSRAHVLQELYATDCVDATPKLLDTLRAQVANTAARAKAYFQAVAQVPQLFFGAIPNPADRCLIDPSSLPN